GRLIADTSIDEILSAGGSTVLVRSPQLGPLADVLRNAGGNVHLDGDALSVSGLDAAAVGDLAGAHAITLHELTPRHASLEEAFFELTDDDVQYRTTSEPATRSAS